MLPSTSLEVVSAHFGSPSPLRIGDKLLACFRHPHQRRRLPRFLLPDVTAVHRHEIRHYYGLVCHPLASFGLAFPLVPPYLLLLAGRGGLPRVSLPACT